MDNGIVDIESSNKNTARNTPDGVGGESDTDSDEGQFDECECTSDSGVVRLDQIPYITVYDDKETIEQRGYFIPAFPVTANIISVERDTSRRLHLINPYIYTIELKHGPFRWQIGRRFIDFQRLHNSLHRYRTRSMFAAPFKKALESAASPEITVLHHTGGGDLIEPKSATETVAQGENVIKGPTADYYKGIQGNEENGTVKLSDVQTASRRFSNVSMKNQRRKQARHTRLPKFPILPDSIIGDDDLDERKAQLQNYLSSILHMRVYREHEDTIQFVEVSKLSFVNGLGAKYKEGVVKRRPGGVYTRGSVRNCCTTHCLKWRPSLLILKDTFLAYLHPTTGIIGEVLLFDRKFQVTTDKDGTEETQGVRKGLHLSNLQRELLVKCRTPDEANYWKSDIQRVLQDAGRIWTQHQPHDSGFPNRSDSYAHWFVDGRSFMQHAANMMDIAKEEIFIADWWLNPQIYMKRPSADDQWRFDMILKRKAEDGVRIFILVYRELEKLLMLGSLHMEQYFVSLHPSIKVLRHPDHLDSQIMSFAHHEKLIVIDQKIAFVGGIDLCYGRWDDHEHRLIDLPGVDACLLHDEEISDLEEIRRAYHEDTSQTDSSKAKAPAGASINYAYNAESENISETILQKTMDIFDVLILKHQRMEELSQLPIWRTKVQSLRDKLKDEEKFALWVGKDYGNAYYKDLPDPQKAFEDFVDRTTVPRMPWHDISSVVYGDAARDVARHFIHRWNDAKHDLVKDDADFPFLLPKSYENTKVPEIFRRMSIACSVQVLRSLSLWSGGLEETEMSIQNAYLNLISEAKHYIYIENQFFVSHVAGTDLHNQIAQKLYERIVRAHTNQETFRVYVMMPLLPGFTKTSGSMQMVLHWTLTSIGKGPRGLLYNLEKTIGDYSPYITFCGLRKHDHLLGKLVTELIYIHSKLMIVDDRYCIIGSANINDRSQVGYRDSEVCVLVEDTQFTPSTMNGKPYKSGTFSGSLRRRLFQEHLGLLHNDQTEEGVHKLQVLDVTDPVSNDFYALWNEIAKSNTRIYDQVFKCAPSDDLKTLLDWAQCEAQTTNLAISHKEKAKELLKGLRGHLVQFPTQFLANADLTKDRFVPESLFMSYIFN